METNGEGEYVMGMEPCIVCWRRVDPRNNGVPEYWNQEKSGILI